MSDSEDFQWRYEMFLTRLLQGGAVPFLGAGISQKARNPANDSFKPTVEWMQVALASEMASHIGKEWDTNKDHCRLVMGVLKVPWKEEEPFPGEDFRSACTKIPFGHLTEVASWVIGHDAVCRAIGIENLKGLKPLPAHRYLSYLAREGLLTEIITTNFDTCIEQAFSRTFPQGDPFWAAQVSRSCLAVVRSLEDYRQHGGRLWTSAGRYQRPVLKLYKINGCAEHPEASEKEYGGVILTERQLHNFSDDRQWTAHLFCDRARSRSLVFSGFGSDEPQIRHTVLTLLEEFSRQTRGKEHDSSREAPICSLPNAPWVTAHGATLSYSQLQVLYAFRRAHQKHEPHLEDCEQHTFTGRDAKHFTNDGSDPQHLEADLFWQRVFQSVYLGLLWRYSDEGSRFYTWLCGLTE